MTHNNRFIWHDNDIVLKTKNVKAKLQLVESLAEVVTDTKVRNYNVDDQTNRNWLKMLQVIEASKKGYSGAVIVLKPITDNLPTLPDGLALEELHITLCYLGEATDFDKNTVLNIVKKLSEKYGTIKLKLNGITRFKETHLLDKDAVVLNADSPQIEDLRRDIFTELNELNIKPERSHGFTPHMTLAYIDKDAETPEVELPQGEIEGEIELWWGEEKLSKKRQGQGQGEEVQGDGGVVICICPKCGREYEHEKGTPCNEIECEECGVALVGQEVKSNPPPTEHNKGEKPMEEESKTILQRLAKGLQDLGKALIETTDEKAAKYQVQSFHSDFGLADPGESWSFSAADGNAILDKGGWELYKKVHLVTDTSEGTTPENKAAYTYPVAKLVNGEPQYFFRAASTVNAGLSGGARGADLPAEVNKKVGATVKKIYKAFERDPEQVSVKEKEEVEVKSDTKQYPSTAFAFKAKDGKTWWLQFTSNAFMDREGEIFTTKSLNDYVNRHRSEDVKGEFWYRHIPGTKFADVKWQAMTGRFLVQAGPFDDTPTGRYFEKFFDQYPNGHPEIAKNGWGTSHGYYYNPEDRKDNIYEWLEIRESTVLPSDIASNPWSPMPVIIQRSEKMNEQEKKDLLVIGGAELVNLVEQQGQNRTKTLEGAVDFKAYEDITEQLQAIMESAKDEDTKQRIQAVIDAVKQEEAGMEYEETEEEEVEEEAEIEEKEAAEEDSSCKEVKEEVEEAEKTREEKEPVPPVEEKGITREEVADGISAVVETMRQEIKSSQEETIKSLTEMIAPLLEEVKQLKTEDDEKIAEKAAQTPAASLRDLIQSAIGAKEVTVGQGDPLLNSRPQENNQQTAANAGVPTFLSNLMTGADQKR